MLPVFVIALGVILLAAVSNMIAPVQYIYQANIEESTRYRLYEIGNAISQYRRNNVNDDLITPDDLTTKPGYEYLRSLNPSFYQSALSPLINDSVWRFSRLAVWFQPTNGYVDEDDYLQAANNSCGDDDFNTGTSWCGRQKSLWVKFESRDSYSDQLLAEKVRMYRIIDKFYRKYSSDQQFSSVANGTSITLSNLAGYSGNAAGCSGVLNYEGIPLNCSDLFNAWGNPISFNKISNNHIALVNRTNVISANGQPIRIAEEAKLE